MKKKIVFSIFAHVDSGKTSLCRQITKYFHIKDNIFDNSIIENTRQVTAFLRSINFEDQQNKYFMIDVPGHIDFIDDTNRAIDVINNAILILDPTIGISSYNEMLIKKLLDKKKNILVIINKIDLKRIEQENKLYEIVKYIFGIDNIIRVSTKTGENINLCIEKIKQFQAFESSQIKDYIFIFGNLGNTNSKTFHKWYIITYTKIESGMVLYNQEGESIRILEVGYISNCITKTNILEPGDIGYIVVKDKVKLGDILTNNNKKLISNIVYDNQFKVTLDVYSNHNFQEIKDILEINKRTIFNFEIINSHLFGKGFRIFAKGKLHLELIIQSIEHLDIFFSFPKQSYKVYISNEEFIYVDEVYGLPKRYKYIEEEYAIMEIKIKENLFSKIYSFLYEKRANIIENILNEDFLYIHCEIPIIECLLFFDSNIKSLTNGAVEYNILKKGIFKKENIVVTEFFLNDELIIELSFLMFIETAKFISQKIIQHLYETIEKRVFKQKIHCKINGRILYSKNVNAISIDIAGKCYGGDIRRKQKLWQKQKEGRKKNAERVTLKLPKKDITSIITKLMKN